DVAPPRELVDVVANRGRQPTLVQHWWPHLTHHTPQLDDFVAETRADGIEHLRGFGEVTTGQPDSDAIEAVARRGEMLDRPVVQLCRQSRSLSFAGSNGLGEQTEAFPL